MILFFTCEELQIFGVLYVTKREEKRKYSKYDNAEIIRIKDKLIFPFFGVSVNHIRNCCDKTSGPAGILQTHGTVHIYDKNSHA
jgi:hypothetical protein